MRKLSALLILILVLGKTNAQVTMRSDKKAWKHAYYPLLGSDTLQISLLNKADRALIPPLDSLFKRYVRDYKLVYDSSRIDITPRRLEYYYDQHQMLVYFPNIVFDEYQVKDGKVYTIKHGKDTVSINGKLSNGRPYRVRFWVMDLRSMLRYQGKLDAMIAPKRKFADAVKKDEKASK